ncbi:MAG: hypothetical protein ACI96M_000001, partial [Candidatus Azotimanducaceae bacterium]
DCKPTDSVWLEVIPCVPISDQFNPKKADDPGSQTTS